LYIKQEEKKVKKTAKSDMKLSLPAKLKLDMDNKSETAATTSNFPLFAHLIF